jgi:hypothetical protein
MDLAWHGASDGAKVASALLDVMHRALLHSLHIYSAHLCGMFVQGSEVLSGRWLLFAIECGGLGSAAALFAATQVAVDTACGTLRHLLSGTCDLSQIARQVISTSEIVSDESGQPAFRRVKVCITTLAAA